jgi:hypothetical protein
MFAALRTMAAVGSIASARNAAATPANAYTGMELAANHRKMRTFKLMQSTHLKLTRRRPRRPASPS